MGYNPNTQSYAQPFVGLHGQYIREIKQAEAVKFQCMTSRKPRL